MPRNHRSPATPILSQPYNATFVSLCHRLALLIRKRTDPAYHLLLIVLLDTELQGADQIAVSTPPTAALESRHRRLDLYLGFPLNPVLHPLTGYVRRVEPLPYGSLRSTLDHPH